MSKRENISIHALREEGDLPVSTICTASCKFLSTPSARRATHFCFRGPHCVVISIHALREEGDIQDRPETPKGGISIHALREEGDPVRLPWWCQSSYFYPRPPRGGRREFGISRIDEKTISIHALREEGDIAATARETIHGDFYPRPPRGGRHRNYVAPRLTELFLSTPSARRATAALRLLHPRRPISIHALREEGDYLLDLLSRMTNEFLSTPSARRATLTEASGSSRPRNFYPRPPRGGRPGRVRAFQQHPRISIHALREEGDSPAPGMSCTQHNFYPRPPRGGRPDPL